MLTIDQVINFTKRLEAILADNYGARGRGLHEKTNAVESNLTPLQIRGLRLIASTRNKLLHEVGYTVDDIPEDFEGVCLELLRTLDSDLEEEEIETEGEPETESDFQEVYCEYLREENLRPSVDSDGDVKFKYEDRNYYIIVNADDPQYFYILYSKFWDIESQEELERAYQAANRVTAKKKVAKVYVTEDEDDVSASIEVFIDKPSSFQSIFWRSVEYLSDAIDEFIERMQEDKEALAEVDDYSGYKPFHR